MPNFIPDEKIQEISERTSIVDVVSQYLSLKKTGRNFLGLCPFHSEKTPSFTVNDEKSIFHCFGCGAGGNVFSFLMKIEGKTFPEAAAELAKKAGVELPERGEQYDVGKANKEEKEKGALYALHEESAVLYHKLLMRSKEGETAREYLKGRGIDGETARAWRLGYGGSGWSTLTDTLETGAPRETAEKAGLILKNRHGGHYDRFRERLLFPTCDIRGNVVAFGGRTLTGENPKYVNSPESEIYRKGRILFGLHRTKEDIRKSGKAILVEGYLDLISLYSAGIRNVAATLGTALTPEQAGLLKRFCGRIVLLFDGDAAGQKAALRGIEIFTAAGMNPFVLTLPSEDDPDTFVRKRGSDALRVEVEKAAPGIDFLIKKELDSRPQKTAADKAAVIRAAAPFIRQIGDPLERKLTAKRAAEMAGVDEELVLDAIGERRGAGKAPQKEKKAPTQQNAAHGKTEETLISLMLREKKLFEKVRDSKLVDCFRDGTLKSVGERILSTPPPTERWEASYFIGAMGDEGLSSAVARLIIDDGAYDGISLEEVYRDCERQIRNNYMREEERRITRELKAVQGSGDQEKIDSLIAEKQKILAARKKADIMHREDMNG